MPDTVLITGANRGIGLALTQQFASRGDRVIAVCRKSSPELEATGARIEPGIDVTDEVAVDALAKKLHGERIDVLFANAGILERDSLDSLDLDGVRRQLEVNALGPLIVVHALKDRLADTAKIALMTSRMGSVEDNTSGAYYGYRASKAALNAIGKSLAIDLAPRGISVILLHPGYVATDMVGGSGDVSPAQAADGLIARVDALTPDRSGTFQHANGTLLPW
jgi:NAD(P)-dependent dehydrogenase (short-subunit alcohol dehydrogenase family)